MDTIVRAGTCESCGVAVAAGRAGPLPRSCTECRRPKPAVRECRGCGVSFTVGQSRGQKLYCEPACRVRQLTGGPQVRECRECGKAFTTTVNSVKVFCDHACYLVWNEAQRSTGPRKRTTETLRKRAALLAQGGKIDKRKVADRDGWECGICHEPIDPAILYPDPMSLSMDHIKPMSRGGLHEWSNVQAAHLRCNCQKGNGLPSR